MRVARHMFKAPLRHLPGGTEKYHPNIHLRCHLNNRAHETELGMLAAE
jgi:hypothetical protein